MSVIGVAQTTIAISSQFLNLITSYLNQPVIGGNINADNLGSEVLQAATNLASEVTGNYVSGGVRIEPTQYRTEYSADISEQLIVNVTPSPTVGTTGTNGMAVGKYWLTDSIAPRPRSWRITGYLSGDLNTDVLGSAITMLGAIPISSYSSGSPGVVNNIIGYGQAALEVRNILISSLTAKQKYLETLFYSRLPFFFKTRDNETITNAVMSELTISRTPQAQNKLGIQVVIHELNILTVSANISSPYAGQKINVGAEPMTNISVGNASSAVTSNREHTSLLGPVFNSP